MNILITGADGFLGGKIVKEIIEKTNHTVQGLTLSMDRIEAMMNRENIPWSDRTRFVTNDDFLSQKTHWNVDSAIHLAFSRRMQPASDIASSIRFAAAIFHKLADSCVPRVINMSSQGIYGATKEIRTEDTLPAPNTQYTMAKYASEVLFDDILKDCPWHTNIRLDPVAQSQNVLIGLCRSAKEGLISLKGGKQVFSFIDADEVPGAVVALLKYQGKWAHSYNVGWNCKRYTLIELADMVANACEKCGYDRPIIELDEDETSLWAGMDSSRFIEATKWEPSIELADTLEKMIRG